MTPTKKSSVLGKSMVKMKRKKKKKEERSYLFSVRGKLQYWWTRYSEQASPVPAQHWREAGFLDQWKDKGVWVNFNFPSLHWEKRITPKHRYDLTPYFAVRDNATATLYTAWDISHLTQLIKNLRETSPACEHLARALRARWNKSSACLLSVGDTPGMQPLPGSAKASRLHPKQRKAADQHFLVLWPFPFNYFLWLSWNRASERAGGSPRA